MIRLRYKMMRIRHCFDSINTFFAYVVSMVDFFKIEFFFGNLTNYVLEITLENI